MRVFLCVFTFTFSSSTEKPSAGFLFVDPGKIEAVDFHEVPAQEKMDPTPRPSL